MEVEIYCTLAKTVYLDLRGADSNGFFAPRSGYFGNMSQEHWRSMVGSRLRMSTGLRGFAQREVVVA